MTYREFSALVKYKEAVVEAENGPQLITKDEQKDMLENFKQKRREHGDYS